MPIAGWTIRKRTGNALPYLLKGIESVLFHAREAAPAFTLEQVAGAVFSFAYEIHQMSKQTPEQKFAKIFMAWMHGGPETEGVRKNAERKVDEWLKRYGKVRGDIPAILLQAARDDEAQKPPPPPPPDPRDDDSGVHPFDDPQFTPLGVVEGLVSKYVTMQPDARIIYAAWICFTHVYQQFAIAPRMAFVSEGPYSGKTTAKNVARRLVQRPNPETGGTAAAITEFIDEGPCTVLIDELDLIDRGNPETIAADLELRT